MIILRIAAYIIIALIILILILLMAPVRYQAKGYKYEGYNLAARVSWIFGAVKFIYSIQEGQKASSSLQLLCFPISFKQKKHDREEKQPGGKAKKKSHGKRFLDRGYRREIFKAFKALWDHAKPHIIYARGRFGFDDPFDTAIVCGFLSCLGMPDETINITPVFEEEILEGKFEIEGKVVPAFLLICYVRFRFSKPVKYILKNERMEKKYVS